MKTANKPNVHWQGEGLSRWDRGTGGLNSACLPPVKRVIEFKTECLMVKVWWTCRGGEGAHGDKDENESGAVKQQDYHLQCAMELRAERLTAIALLIWNHIIIETFGGKEKRQSAYQGSISDGTIVASSKRVMCTWSHVFSQRRRFVNGNV